jgi:hypothetical protein
METFMRQTILSCVGALVFSSGLFAADSQLLNLVMPDAQVMAGLNVTTAKTSTFGQFLLTQLASREGTQFDKLSALTGFDPRRDLTEVLAASVGTPGSKSGLILAKGSFNVSQLADAIRKDSPNATVSTYNGATLVTHSGKDDGAVAFLDTSIAIAGDSASVKAAIDRSNQANSLSPALSAKVQALSASQDAWTVTTQPLSSFAPKADPNVKGPGAQIGQVLKNIQAANGGVKFGSLIVVTAQATANDAANANALADVVRMLAGLATMQAQKNPQITAIVNSLQVSTDGATVNVSLSLPEADAEQLFKSAGVGAAKGH